jgi:RNA polymerase sigma-70 factor (ECF subfamily)
VAAPRPRRRRRDREPRRLAEHGRRAHQPQRAARPPRAGEDAAAVHLPSCVIAPADDRDPEHEALVADSVGLALLVVLETLSPAERLAFVLHDVFAVPFDEIAAMLDSTTGGRAAAGQLARAGACRDPARAGRQPAGQREVVDAFFAAGRDGDLDRLVAVLHPDVVLRTDVGVPRRAFRRRSPGRRPVAERARSFADPIRRVLPVTVNGAAGAVIVVEGTPVAVMAFTVVGGRVAAIDGLADPQRLARIDVAALGG